MKVTYTIVSDTVTPDIRSRLARVQNPEPALRRMGAVLVNWARQAFRDASKRPTTWPSLSKRTLDQKKKKGYGSKPLIASGTSAWSLRVVERSCRCLRRRRVCDLADAGRGVLGFGAS